MSKIIEFYPSAKYRAEIPKPAEIIGHQIGEYFTHYSDLMNYYRQLAAISPQVKLIEYGRSYERRPLVLLAISSAENLARLEEIKSSNRALGDPRLLDERELAELLPILPATVWMSYNVHGDEAACSEAALEVVYHLLADESEETANLLKELIIVIDPIVNPDGRERYVSFYEQAQGVKPRSDSNAVEHQQSWPGGRFNHYLFDLNRDWAWMTQQESQGRVRAFREWQPQVHVDFHEMQEDATYFFPPVAKPQNANIPPMIEEWLKIYGAGNAEMLAKFGISFYTGEDFDLYHPSYGDSWPSLNGAVGMTYEQAGSGRAGLSVKLKDRESTVTLRERAWHHFLTSIASLKTTAAHREARLRDFYQFRVQAIEAGRKESMKMLVMLPGHDPARAAKLAALLVEQGIEVLRTRESFNTAHAHNYFDTAVIEREFPAGSYVVDLAQPAGFLAKGLLEPEAVLKDIYFYDITGWSLPLAYGIETYWLEEPAHINVEKLSLPIDYPGRLVGEHANYGYVFSYETNGAAHTLSRLLQEDYEAFIALKPFAIAGRNFNRGAIIVPVNNNAAALHQRITALALANGHEIIAAESSRTTSGIDLGSYRVRHIRRPKLLVVMGKGVSQTGYGSLWHLFDQRFELDFTPITIEQLAGIDLREYNTLILPDDNSAGKNYTAMIGKPVIDKLNQWIKEGGCLIAIKGAAVFTTAKQSGLTTIEHRFLSRQLEQERLEREREKDPAAKPAAKELTLEDREKLLIPYGEKEHRRMKEIVPGTLMRLRLDNSHPLAAGYEEEIVVLNVNSPILTLTEKGDNVAYYPKEKFKLSGFITPENEEKIALSGYLIKERSGKGSVILYADDPFFRSFWEGTVRLFLNSILFGGISDPYIDR